MTKRETIEKRFDEEFQIGVQYSANSDSEEQFAMKNNKGNCDYVTNKDILDFLFTTIEEVERDLLKEIDELIVEEMLICQKENTPTSRLTSLSMKIHTLTKAKEEGLIK